MSQSSSSERVALKPAVSASLVRDIKFKHHSRLTELEMYRIGPAIPILTSPLSDADER